MLITSALSAGCSFVDGGLFGSSNGGGTGGGDGAGGGGDGGAPVITTSSSTSGMVTTSSGVTSSSSTTSSSGGKVVCGDGICEPPETQQFCPQDCNGGSGNGPSSSSSSGGGGNGAMCNHGTCDTGGPLKVDCDECTKKVCAADPFCCDTNWDGVCVGEANSMCGACCGNGTCDSEEKCDSCPQDCGPCPLEAECPHSVCFESVALDPMKCWDPCVATVCAQLPDCCNGNGYQWTAKCQAAAQAACPGGDPCVKAVCAKDASCCTTAWSQACIDLAKTECNTQCDCPHSICQSGEKLSPDCNPCAKAVCASDPFCCNNDWDGICTGEVASVCGIKCN